MSAHAVSLFEILVAAWYDSRVASIRPQSGLGVVQSFGAWNVSIPNSDPVRIS